MSVTHTVILLSAWGDRVTLRHRLQSVATVVSLWSVIEYCRWLLRGDIPLWHRLKEAIVSPWRVMLYLAGRRDEAHVLRYTWQDIRRDIFIATPYSDPITTVPTGTQPTPAERVE